MDLSPTLFLLLICAAAAVAGASVTGARALAGSAARLVPVLQVRTLPLLCIDGHRGDGDGAEKRWIFSTRCLVLSQFSSVLVDGRWRLLKFQPFHGCDGSGRRPASSSPPMTFLVERRHVLFLPACMPKRRQSQHLFGGFGLQVMRPWQSRRPKWSVPGAGVIQSDEELIWTRSRFLIPVRGPFCKSQGLWCSFLFMLDFLVKCTAPMF